MKITTLRLHSEIGPITNSSSEIFVYSPETNLQNLQAVFSHGIKVLETLESKAELFAKVYHWQDLDNWPELLQFFNILEDEGEVKLNYLKKEKKDFCNWFASLFDGMILLSTGGENEGVDSASYCDLEFVWWHLG